MGILRAVGKHDRRNSQKMKRRKGQVKKKARLKRQKTERRGSGEEGHAREAGTEGRSAGAPRRDTRGFRVSEPHRRPGALYSTVPPRRMVGKRAGSLGSLGAS
jgi:hypothetical protein